MPLNKTTGNMYPWVTHTWNRIRGRCPHECSYCYMKGKPASALVGLRPIGVSLRARGSSEPEADPEGPMARRVGELRFVESEMKTPLGSGKKIFVGSSIDMFAEEVPGVWISEVLRKCRLNSGRNSYLFQTKNPTRIGLFAEVFPMEVMIGTTIESNKDYPSISKAPNIEERAYWMRELHYRLVLETMISIEPILDFDLNHFIRIVEGIKPVFVSIGADSKDHQLPEPSPEKTR